MGGSDSLGSAQIVWTWGKKNEKKNNKRKQGHVQRISVTDYRQILAEAKLNLATLFSGKNYFWFKMVSWIYVYKTEGLVDEFHLMLPSGLLFRQEENE